MQPAGLESVRLERKLLAESDQSLWFALSIADSREELLARKAQFLKLDSVERTEEIASLLPEDSEGKRAIIERIHHRIASLPDEPAQIPIDSVPTLRRTFERLQSLAKSPSFDPRARAQLDEAKNLLLGLPTAECYRRLSAYQDHLARDLLERLHMLRGASDPEPPHLSDLPAGLVKRFVGQSGRHLLKIYSKANIWDMDALEQFVQDVRATDPRATGKPLQTYEASRQIQRSYLQAALYSLIAVTVVLVVDYRSLRVTLLALLPVGLGMLHMFGLLGWLDIPLNPANMIVLPLILGIGIDDGVHVMHDFRSQTRSFRLTSSTANSIVMTSLTSTVGFGSLMIASHRGLESLGRVLTIGVTFCLITSLMTLPALLCLLSDRKGRKAERAASDPPAFPDEHPRHRPHFRKGQPPQVPGRRAFPSERGIGSLT
jgi:hypothetical protein